MLQIRGTVLTLKRLFVYLLAISILGGMGSRLVVHDQCKSAPAKAPQEVAEHAHEHDCCPSPDPTPSPAPCESPCDPGHDQHCPMDHHHHHIGCAHVMPLVADSQSRISFHSSVYSRLLLSVEDACAPEAPVYEMDKPPLI